MATTYTPTTLTLLAGPIAAREHLLAAHTPHPSLHPNAHTPDRGWRHPYRWAGWNETAAGCVDANGRAVTIRLWHFADGYTHYAVQGPGAGAGATLSPDPHDVFDRLAYPLAAMTAMPVINHPEWTPGEDGQPIHPVTYARERDAIRRNERRAGYVADWHGEF